MLCPCSADRRRICLVRRPCHRLATGHVTEASGLPVGELTADSHPPRHASATNSDGSLVTTADKAAQALIGRVLGQTFPDDPIVAEEDSELLRTSGGMALLKEVTHRLAVSKVSAPTVAAWCESFDPTHTDQARSAATVQLLGLARPPVRVGSQVKYASVAAGNAACVPGVPAPGQGSVGGLVAALAERAVTPWTWIH